MPEDQDAQRRKDISRSWARITRGGADALATSADFGRLALYAYEEGRDAAASSKGERLPDSAAELTGMATAAALQKLAHVQAAAAEQQMIQSLLQFAALEGLGVSLHLRQQAAQAAADALGLAPEPLEEPPAPPPADTPGDLDRDKW